MGPLVITSNQCQLDSGRVPYGVGEASGTRNFKLWVIITIVVVCRSPVRMWIDLVDGKQTNKPKQNKKSTTNPPQEILCFPRPAHSPQVRKEIWQTTLGMRRDVTRARLAVVIRLKVLLWQPPLQSTETFYKRCGERMTRCSTFCKAKYFRISPLTWFPEYSIHFSCTNTISTKV